MTNKIVFQNADKNDNKFNNFENNQSNQGENNKVSNQKHNNYKIKKESIVILQKYEKRHEKFSWIEDLNYFFVKKL